MAIAGEEIAQTPDAASVTSSVESPAVEPVSAAQPTLGQSRPESVRNEVSLVGTVKSVTPSRGDKSPGRLEVEIKNGEYSNVLPVSAFREAGAAIGEMTVGSRVVVEGYLAQMNGKSKTQPDKVRQISGITATSVGPAPDDLPDRNSVFLRGNLGTQPEFRPNERGGFTTMSFALGPKKFADVIAFGQASNDIRAQVDVGDGLAIQGRLQARPGRDGFPASIQAVANEFEIEHDNVPKQTVRGILTRDAKVTEGPSKQQVQIRIDTGALGDDRYQTAVIFNDRGSSYAAQNFTKGASVEVIGKSQTDTYNDKEGVEKTWTFIKAKSIRPLERDVEQVAPSAIELAAQEAVIPMDAIESGTMADGANTIETPADKLAVADTVEPSSGTQIVERVASEGRRSAASEAIVTVASNDLSQIDLDDLADQAAAAVAARSTEAVIVDNGAVAIVSEAVVAPLAAAPEPAQAQEASVGDAFFATFGIIESTGAPYSSSYSLSQLRSEIATGEPRSMWIAGPAPTKELADEFFSDAEHFEDFVAIDSFVRDNPQLRLSDVPAAAIGNREAADVDLDDALDEYARSVGPVVASRETAPAAVATSLPDTDLDVDAALEEYAASVRAAAASREAAAAAIDYEQLASRISHADWDYAYADDSRAYRDGQKQTAAILSAVAAAARLEPEQTAVFIQNIADNVEGRQPALASALRDAVEFGLASPSVPKVDLSGLPVYQRQPNVEIQSRESVRLAIDQTMTVEGRSEEGDRVFGRSGGAVLSVSAKAFTDEAPQLGDKIKISRIDGRDTARSLDKELALDRS